MLNHWIVVPVVLPAVLGPFIIMVIRHHLDLQRIFSIAGTVALLGVTIGLMTQAATGTIQVYELGDWPAPFGIVLVLDRLSGLMVLLTALLALIVLLYAVGTGWDSRGRHFHALYQFQLMGIMGAFLTGDAFNLFVFFEVLLIASYGLMIHGGGATRLRAGMQYVVYNLLGSTLFLFALGTLYAVTGTLNMADLAERIAALPADDTALIRVGAVLLLLVFAVKGAVLPLHFWLPGSYANAPAPVAALFAIMTKVGAYAILRMYTLVFGPDQAATAGLSGTWLLPAAMLTLALGAIGVLGSRRLGRLAAYSTIASVGTLMIAISLFTAPGAAAAIYYMVHSTFATAMLFLVADLVCERSGNDRLRASLRLPQSGLIAALFFAATVALAGMPPLSGFIGKLLVLDAARSAPGAVWIWGTILITSLILILGYARAGSLLFWKPFDATHDLDNPDPEEAEAQTATPRPAALPFVAVFALLAVLVTLTVLAGPMMDYANATADQLYDTGPYRDAVLRRTTQ
jgi:multicomponent K+:H+ antiporter subunit D